MNLFEISVRPPNATIFNTGNSSPNMNHYHQQHQLLSHQNHPRRAAQINSFKQQRSSSVSSAFANHNNNNTSNSTGQSSVKTTHVPLSLKYSANLDNNNNTTNTTNNNINQNNLHSYSYNYNPNSINNNNTSNNSFNYFSNYSTPSSPLITSHNQHNSTNNQNSIGNGSGKYVARVVANKNGLRTLVSSSASYLQPNETNDDFIHLTTTKNNMSNGTTILPVYYQSDSNNTKTTLPILKNPGQATSPSNFIRTVNTTTFPNLVSNSANSGVGSATAIIHNNNNNNNHYSPNMPSGYSYAQQQQQPHSNQYARIYQYGNPQNRINSFEYPIKISSKQFSVLKGLKARNDMLNSGVSPSSPSSPSSSASSSSSSSDNHTNNARSNFTYFNLKKEDDHSKPSFLGGVTSQFLVNESNRLKNNDSPASIVSNATSTTSNTNSNTSSSTNGLNSNGSSTTSQKSILVNRKKFSNPTNNMQNTNNNNTPYMPKKTVTFAS